MPDGLVEHYQELRRTLRSKRCFERQYLYYAVDGLTIILLAAAAVTLASLFPILAVQLISAGILAIAFARIGFLVHDLGHGQVFLSRERNLWAMLPVGMSAGVSKSWWNSVHNMHHAQTNDIEEDPHLQIPFMVFSPEQYEETKGLRRFIIRFQMFYVVPFMCLEAFNVHIVSVVVLARERTRAASIELGGVVLGVVLSAVLCWIISDGQLATFFAVFAVSKVATGLYLASVFAPNHKAMPLAHQQPASWIERQVVSSRNIRHGRIIDWWFAGLNYQIEHHLFPSMPRNRLRLAQAEVSAWCEQRGWVYTNSGFWEAYGDALGHFGRVVSRKQARQLAQARAGLTG